MQQFAKFHLDYKLSRPLLEATRWLHPSRTRSQSSAPLETHRWRQWTAFVVGVCSSLIPRVLLTFRDSSSLPPALFGTFDPSLFSSSWSCVGSIRGRSCWCNPLAPSTAHHLEGFCLFRKPELFTRCTVEDTVSVFVIYLVDDIL